MHKGPVDLRFLWDLLSVVDVLVMALCLNTPPMLIIPHALEIHQISPLLFKTYATSTIQPKWIIKALNSKPKASRIIIWRE